MSPLVPAVVSRAKLLQAAGFSSNSYPDPQSVPDSAQRLEFVGGHWVRFVPYLQNGTTHMVVAWVPKQGLDPEVDDQETEAPPPGAPAYAPSAGPALVTPGGVSSSSIILGSTEAQQLQAQVTALYNSYTHTRDALTKLIGQYQLLRSALWYVTQATMQLDGGGGAALPFLNQAGVALFFNGQTPASGSSIVEWEGPGSPWLEQPVADQTVLAALSANDSLDSLLSQTMMTNVVSGTDLRELTADEAAAEGLQ